MAVVSGESVLVNGPFGVATGSSNDTKVVSLSDDHEFGGFNAKTITVDVLQSLRNDDGSQVDPTNIAFFISGSPVTASNATRDNMFISASGFIVTADGNVTASNIDLSGGLSSTFVFAEQKLKVGGTPVEPNVIISASGLVDAPKFRIDEVGFITASGGFLGKWFINDDGLSSLKSENGSTAQDNVDFFLSGSASTAFSNGDRRRMIISSSFFNVTADGTITASNIDLSGGLTSTFVFADQALKVGGTPDAPNVIISASGLVSSLSSD